MFCKIAISALFFYNLHAYTLCYCCPKEVRKPVANPTVPTVPTVISEHQEVEEGDFIKYVPESLQQKFREYPDQAGLNAFLGQKLETGISKLKSLMYNLYLDEAQSDQGKEFFEADYSSVSALLKAWKLFKNYLSTKNQPDPEIRLMLNAFNASDDLKSQKSSVDLSNNQLLLQYEEKIITEWLGREFATFAPAQETIEERANHENPERSSDEDAESVKSEPQLPTQLPTAVSENESDDESVGITSNSTELVPDPGIGEPSTECILRNADVPEHFSLADDLYTYIAAYNLLLSEMRTCSDTEKAFTLLSKAKDCSKGIRDKVANKAREILSANENSPDIKSIFEDLKAAVGSETVPLKEFVSKTYAAERLSSFFHDARTIGGLRDKLSAVLKRMNQNYDDLLLVDEQGYESVTKKGDDLNEAINNTSASELINFWKRLRAEIYTTFPAEQRTVASLMSVEVVAMRKQFKSSEEMKQRLLNVPPYEDSTAFLKDEESIILEWLEKEFDLFNGGSISIQAPHAP